MFYELKEAKTMLEIPRFRAELPKYHFKGMVFTKFTNTFGAIYKDIQHKFKQNTILTDRELAKTYRLEAVCENEQPMPLKSPLHQPSTGFKSQVATLTKK